MSLITGLPNDVAYEIISEMIKHNINIASLYNTSHAYRQIVEEVLHRLTYQNALNVEKDLKEYEHVDISDKINVISNIMYKYAMELIQLRGKYQDTYEYDVFEEIIRIFHSATNEIEVIINNSSIRFDDLYVYVSNNLADYVIDMNFIEHNALVDFNINDEPIYGDLVSSFSSLMGY